MKLRLLGTFLLVYICKIGIKQLEKLRYLPSVPPSGSRRGTFPVRAIPNSVTEMQVTLFLLHTADSVFMVVGKSTSVQLDDSGNTWRNSTIVVSKTQVWKLAN